MAEATERWQNPWNTLGNVGMCLCAKFSLPFLGAEKRVLVCCPSRANLQEMTVVVVVVVVFSFSLSIFIFFFGQLSTSLKCFNEEILTAGRSGDEKQS